MRIFVCASAPLPPARARAFPLPRQLRVGDGNSVRRAAYSVRSEGRQLRAAGCRACGRGERGASVSTDARRTVGAAGARLGGVQPNTLGSRADLGAPPPLNKNNKPFVHLLQKGC